MSLHSSKYQRIDLLFIFILSFVVVTHELQENNQNPETYEIFSFSSEVLAERKAKIEIEIQKIEIVEEFRRQRRVPNYTIQQQANRESQVGLNSYKGTFFGDLSHFCSMKEQKNAIISKIFSFQSHTQSYIGYSVVNQESSQFVFLNSQCQDIARLDSHPIIDVLTDRNNLPHGSLFLISSHHQIFACSQITNFTDCAKVTRFSEYGSFEGEYIGGMTRSKSKGSIQVFIIQNSGPIMVFDQNGNNKLGISFEYESPIISVIDHHPDPIIATKTNWLFYVDTHHYTISPTNCVYPNMLISKLICTNPYSPYFYLASDDSLLKYQIKPQNKNCDLFKRVYSPSMAYVDFQNDSIEEYSNSLFMGNTVLNLSSSAPLLESIQICTESLQMAFRGWRNYQKNGFIGMSCCKAGRCSVEMFKGKEPQEYEKKTVFLITMSLLLFLWGIFYFFRSVEPKFMENQEALIEYERHNNGFKEEVDSFLSKKKTRNPTKNNSVPSNKKQI